MRDQRAAADLDDGRAVAAAALFALLEAEIVDVGDEVDVPDPFAKVLPFALEIIGLAVEAVAKDIGAVEDEFLVVQKIHHQRRGSKRDIARGLIAAAVEVLKPGVERNDE